MFRSFLRKGNIREILPETGRDRIQAKEEVITRIEEELVVYSGRIKRSIQMQEVVIAKGTLLCKRSKELSEALRKYLELDSEPKSPIGSQALSLFANFCLIQQDAEQGMYRALQDKYINPAQALLRHLDSRHAHKKQLEQARKDYQDKFAKASALLKKCSSKPKDGVKTYALLLESSRAEYVYLDRLEACAEVYLTLRLHAELEMTNCVVSLARALLPVNQTRMAAMRSYSRKMEEVKLWVDGQRLEFDGHQRERAAAVAEAAALAESSKYDALVALLGKGSLNAALLDLSTHPEMGTIKRVIFPHIFRILKAHSYTATSIQSYMTPDSIDYAQQQDVTIESVFEIELPSLANFLKTNYSAITNFLAVQNQRDATLELASVLGQLFCKKIV